jgi:16S rRNA G1207 methylase RsmC
MSEYEMSHAGRALTLLEADLQQTRAALTAARAEVAEADGVIAVWRRRTQQAEATAARLREALEQLGQILHCTGAPLPVTPTAEEVMAYLEQARPHWQARIDAALAAKEACSPAPAYADYYAACQCGHALNIHATSHGHPCRVEQCECQGYVKAALAAEQEADRGE